MKLPRYTGEKTDRVENVPEVRASNSGLSVESFRRAMIITNDHRKTLPLVWGKPHQHYMGEYRNHVWRIERDGNIYWVFTSLRGTTVEWDTRGDSTKVVSFMDWFEEQCTEALRLGDPEELKKIMDVGQPR